MIRIIDKIIILIIIFLGENVLGALSINLNSFYATLIAMAIIPSMYYYVEWRHNRTLVFLLSFVIIFAVYRLNTDHGEGTRAGMMAILGAPIIFSAFPSKYNYKSILFWRFTIIMFLIGYLFETGLSIFERLSGYNVFGWHGDTFYSIKEYGVTDYRCTALYGHPLGNALIITIAMSFVLISRLKAKIKFFLWGVGFLSILCFNARSSIVGNFFLLIIYIFYSTSSEKKISGKTKLHLILGALVVGIVSFLIFSYGGWGGRLIKMGLMDDSSAQVRVNAWTLFDYYDIKDFLYPHTFNEAAMIKRTANLTLLENPWLGLIVYNGIIFGLIYIILYVYFIKKLLQRYALFDKLFVTCAFLMIASASNSFDTSFFCVIYFLLMCILFSPVLFSKIVDRKYQI